ncbi:MAG TPA: glycosyltransferase [Flavobacterium sp.]|uniref:glycosyltransferase n=1 Tax=Flavobacterium sp. TaxID=239 RepID=UPI0028E434B6|nr:glycosyltransferase [uncultured Flavobacterium sp.]
MAKSAMLFFGFNSMRIHKRGVENVIHFQSLASPFDTNYYLHWDVQTKVSRFGNLVCIGVKKNFFWIITLNILLFKLKKNKQIFIHSHNPLMSIGSCFQSNLFTVHDGVYYFAKVTKHKLKYVFVLLEKLLYLRCDFVHFISFYTKKMSLYKGINNCIIPNTSHFENFKTKNIVNKEITCFKTGVIKVFTVRSIEERALIDLLIDVAKLLKDENFEFLIAGKGPLLKFYQEKIKEQNLDNISLLGYVADDELIQYYKNSDVILIPAAYGEGFGLPIIEGYLFNKPVIASNICAIPEIIISNDFLFENNVKSIITKLNRSRKNENNNFKNHYDTYFSNNIVISKMNELYTKLY